MNSTDRFLADSAEDDAINRVVTQNFERDRLIYLNAAIISIDSDIDHVNSLHVETLNKLIYNEICDLINKVPKLKTIDFKKLPIDAPQFLGNNDCFKFLIEQLPHLFEDYHLIYSKVIKLFSDMKQSIRTCSTSDLAKIVANREFEKVKNELKDCFIYPENSKTLTKNINISAEEKLINIADEIHDKITFFKKENTELLSTIPAFLSESVNEENQSNLLQATRDSEFEQLTHSNNSIASNEQKNVELLEQIDHDTIEDNKEQYGDRMALNELTTQTSNNNEVALLRKDNELLKKDKELLELKYKYELLELKYKYELSQKDNELLELKYKNEIEKQNEIIRKLEKVVSKALVADEGESIVEDFISTEEHNEESSLPGDTIDNISIM